MNVRVLLLGAILCLVGVVAAREVAAQECINEPPQLCYLEQGDCSGGLDTPGWSSDLHVDLVVETTRNYGQVYFNSAFVASDLETLPGTGYEFGVEITTIKITCEIGQCNLSFIDNDNLVQRTRIEHGWVYVMPNASLRRVNAVLATMQLSATKIYEPTRIEVTIEINDQSWGTSCGYAAYGHATMHVDVYPWGTFPLFVDEFESLPASLGPETP